MSDPILPLAPIAEGTTQIDIEANDNFLRLEALSRPCLGVADDESGSDAQGDVWIVGDSPSGAFALFDEDDIAIFDGVGWHAWAPVEGLRLVVDDVRKVYTGSWVDDPSVSGGGGGGAVDSVNGQTGVVTLDAEDVGAVATIVPGTGVTIDDTDPQNPVINASGGGGGLTHWSEGVNTSAPNNTGVPAVSLSASNAASSVDAAIIAKGTGATLAQIPDNSTAGGNKRGDYATDLQKLRSNSAHVASGPMSVIAGGQRNTASGTDSAVGGGYQNTASQQSATVSGGRTNTASATGATVSGGVGNVASSNYATVIGGQLNYADGAHSVAMGFRARCRGIQGAVARSVGGFNNFDGDGQSRAFYLCAATTNDTPGAATTDRAAGGTANQVVLPNNSAFVVKATVVARENATGDTASWEVTAHIRRGANAASTAMVAAASATQIAADAGAAAWSLSVDADTSNGALRFSVTGEASHSIKWGVDVYSCNEVVS